MERPHPSDLPWLDRLAIHIPGYGGYIDRGHRRSADQVLRDVVAQRLQSARSHIELAIRQCVDRGAVTHIEGLDRIARHLDRVADRVRSAGSGTDRFYAVGDLPPDKADPIHHADLRLFELADALSHQFNDPDPDHDRLAHFEKGLTELEHHLDQRAMMLQNVP